MKQVVAIADIWNPVIAVDVTAPPLRDPEAGNSNGHLTVNYD